MSQYKKEKIDILLSRFRYFVICYEFCRLVFPVSEGVVTLVITILLSVISLIGLVSSFRKNIKRFFSLVNICVCIILFMEFVITYIMTHQYIQMLECWLLQFIWLSLYLQIDEDTPKELITAEIQNMSKLIILLTFFASLVGVSQSILAKLNILPNSEVILNTIWDKYQFLGVFHGANIQGIVSLLSLTFSGAGFVHSIGLPKSFLAMNFILQIWCLIASNGRAPLLAFIVAAAILLVYVIKHTDKTDKKGKIIVTGSIIVFTLALLGGIAVVATRLGDFDMASLTDQRYMNYINGLKDPNAPFVLTPLEYKLNNLSSNRIALWKMAIVLTMRFPHPFTGWGMGTFYEVMLSVYDFSSPRFAKLMHSMFIQAFYETGFPGLISFILIIIVIIRSGIKVIKKEEEPYYWLLLFLVFIEILVNCSLDPGVWFRKFFYSGIFWLMGGYFIYLGKQEDKEKS